MPFPRQAGILLHPTSLPGRYGIGEIGPDARRWLAHLNTMGQKIWQVLPLGPTGYADSPYQTLSTFAGNPALISFDSLRDDSLLQEADLQDFPTFPENYVDYGPVLAARSKILQRVAREFDRRATPILKAAWMRFCEDESKWLEDYALFAALKDEQGNGHGSIGPSHFAGANPQLSPLHGKNTRRRSSNGRFCSFFFSTSGSPYGRKPANAGFP